MMKLYLITFIFLFSTAGLLFGQSNRYTEEVFSDDQITISSDIKFATNATILPLLFQGATEFLPEDLLLDVYQPDPGIDTISDRPVVMVVHGGDGLPQGINGACWGDKTDTFTVALSMKLAKMGYVAVAPNYRLGWNPLAPSQDDFLDGLTDAGMRVSQDLRACARFLRMDVAEMGNSYGINPDKIAIWGTHTTGGTYSGLATYVTEVEEVQTPTYFVTDSLGNIRNVVDIMELGNLDGTVVGVNALGDTTNYVNWPDYSSAFQMSVLGSAISFDPGIIDEGEAPMIMTGNPLSPVTSVPEGPIQLPTTGEVVAFVQLSRGLIAEANEVGINDAWLELDDELSMAQRADPIFGGVEGWLPTYGDPENEYPYVWWDEVNCEQSESSFSILPGANRDFGLTQLDTMVGYFAPRACITLDLNCGVSTSIRNNILEADLVNVSPNPSQGYLNVQSTNASRLMETISIHAIDGKLVHQVEVNNHVLRLDDLNLQRGMYTVIVRFEDGIVPKKLIIN